MHQAMTPLKRIMTGLLLGVFSVSSAAQIVIDDEALREAQPQTSAQTPPAQPPSAAPTQPRRNTNNSPSFRGPIMPEVFDPSASGYQPPSDAFVDFYYRNMMDIDPYLPQNLRTAQLGCDALTPGNTQKYGSSLTAQYAAPYWESRVKSDWTFFDTPVHEGKLTVIDYAQVTEQGQTMLGYRYLANDNTYHLLYEPWHSASFMAFSGAIAKTQTADIGAYSMVGATPMSDLLNSLFSFKPLAHTSQYTTQPEVSDISAEAIAEYLTNVAGRDYLTSLLHDRWLLLHQPQIRFRGAYSPYPFEPTAPSWLDKLSNHVAPISAYENAAADPGYQGYNCSRCGKLGNKPMTTLAQAEWLKRLATHDRDPFTQHPELETTDVLHLFYGKLPFSNRTNDIGGMHTGLSRILHQAVAEAIAGEPVNNPKRILDNATRGQWRIFQTVGWGTSTTRDAGEKVLVAHVCLPHYQGGREFTLAAQTSYPAPEQRSIHHAGIKMQRLLASAMTKLLK